MPEIIYPVIYEGRTYLPEGEVPGLPANAMLNCGHRRARHATSTLAAYELTRTMPPVGYAYHACGYTLCPDCASEWELVTVLSTDAFTGYLSGSGSASQHVSSFWGVPLMRLTRRSTSARIWLPGGYGSYCRVTVRAEAADGSQWYGHGTDFDCLIHMRRFTTAPRWDR